MSGRSAFRSIWGRLMTSRSSTYRMSKTMYVAGSVFARYSMLIFPLARSRSCNFSKLGSAPFITTTSPSRIASFLVWTFRSGYRSSMKFSRRFWNRRPLRTKARARVPSHFSSKMWSGESNGASRLSASIGLITCVYGSKDGIRSAGLRRLEARLQRGHEVLRRLRLDLRDRGQLFALDLRLNERHERVPIAVPELRGVELRRQRTDQLERELDFCVADHDRMGRRRLRGRLHLVLVHEGREDEAAVEGTDRDKLLFLPEHRARDGHLARAHERLAEQLERLQADLFRAEVVVPLSV